MKSIIPIISFVAVITVQIFSQVEIPVFEKMEGTWEGIYEANGVKYKENISMTWILNHDFFNVVIKGSELNKEENKYEEIYYFTLNNEGNITGWNFDNNGFSNVMNFKGITEDNKVMLSGANDNTECNIIFELRDKQLVQKREFKAINKEAEKKEIVYASVRYDYGIKSLTSKYDKIGEKGLAYVCHLTENTVTVFDPNTNELLGNIPCGSGSGWICFSPMLNCGFISNFKSNSITVFDRKTNETFKTIDAGENPTFLLPVKEYVLISHQSQDGIWVLNTNSYTVTKKLNEGTGPLYLIDKENKIYQPQIFTPYLFIIDPLKFEIKKKIKTGGRPMEMAFIQDRRYGYMVNYDFNEVTKFDTKTDNIVKHISNIYHPRGIESSPEGKFIYVTNVVDGKVIIISTGTDSVTNVIEGFKMPVSIAFTADGKYAYVLNQSASSISVIDTGTYTIVQTFYVASNPISLLIDKVK